MAEGLLIKVPGGFETMPETIESEVFEVDCWNSQTGEWLSMETFGDLFSAELLIQRAFLADVEAGTHTETSYRIVSSSVVTFGAKA